MLEMIVELNTCQFQLCQYRYFNLRTDHPIVSCILTCVGRCVMINQLDTLLNIKLIVMKCESMGINCLRMICIIFPLIYGT